MNSNRSRHTRCLIALIATSLMLAGCTEPAHDATAEPPRADHTKAIDPGVLQGLVVAGNQIGWGNILTGMTAGEMTLALDLNAKFQLPMEGDLDHWIPVHLYDESIVWFDGKGHDVMITRIFLPMPDGWDETDCLGVLERLFTDLEYAEGADSQGGVGAEGASKLYLLTEHPDVGIRLSADGLWLGNQTVRAILPLSSPV